MHFVRYNLLHPVTNKLALYTFVIMVVVGKANPLNLIMKPCSSLKFNGILIMDSNKIKAKSMCHNLEKQIAYVTRQQDWNGYLNGHFSRPKMPKRIHRYNNSKAKISMHSLVIDSDHISLRTKSTDVETLWENTQICYATYRVCSNFNNENEIIHIGTWRNI